MAFRRRAKPAAQGPADAPTDAEPPEAVAPAVGPWDAGAIPDDEILRVDLGGLRIPAVPDVEVRLETDPAGAVAAVVLLAGASTLQLGAFAAPRREGIWDEVRAEIAESLRTDGGASEERDGPFGQELVATVPGPQGRQSARFVGVDGPRWFLRGVFTGPAATDPTQARLLETALREVVVDRGADPLPVRDPLPLVLPREVLEPPAGEEGVEAPVGDDERGRPAPGLPERGPEITETH